jgi:hypothetical protein
MAAATLRHYSAALTNTSATTLVTVPASRALVISKIVVAASGAATVTLTVGGQDIATALPLTAGQVYTETGLVALAAETVTATASAGNTLIVHVFGEEVDN